MNIDEFKHSVYSDASENYRTPSEPDYSDSVCIKLRVLKNSCKRVMLFLNDLEIGMLMTKCRSNENFDWYETSFVCPNEKVSYYFLLETEDKYYYYQKIGVWDDSSQKIPESKYDFSFIPGFHAPDWAKGALQYQIFTDRFCNGDTANDVCNNEYYYTVGHAKHENNWDAKPSDTDIRMFYGGDLKGIYQKLDYLQNLGVEAIYLNPIFVSPSSHKYDTQDYEHIDPHFGVIMDDVEHEMQSWEKHNGFAPKYIKRVTSILNLEASDRYFEMLCNEIHARGMKIILDGVFNHCGSFNKWMDREGIYRDKKGFKPGAYGNPDSPYREYFNFLEHGNKSMGEYEGWWGYTTLPKLNYEKSPQLCEKIFSIAEKWASPPYNIDGWRLDVAADLGHTTEFNHWFWQSFRTRLKNINPNILIIAEHYGDPHDWLNGSEWDSIMNYDAFMEPVSYFLTGMEKHSDSKNDELYQNAEAFFECMNRKTALLGDTPVKCAMNQLSNHDHSRFLTRTNRQIGRMESCGSDAAGNGINKAVFRNAIVIQMTWTGCPTIYYGDEAGVVGWTDPDCRRTYPWGHEDTELIEFHKKLAEIRNRYGVIKNGSLIELYAQNGVIGYARFDDENCIITVCNSKSEKAEIIIPVKFAGVENNTTMKQLLLTDSNGIHYENDNLIKVENGEMKLSLPGFASGIYCL